MFLAGQNRYTANQDDFAKIPGAPVAYWVSNNFINNYCNKKLSEFGDAKQGLISGDNERFLRLWFEIQDNKMSRKCFHITKGESLDVGMETMTM